MNAVTIALAQTPVSVDISRNAHQIGAMMRKAAVAEERLSAPAGGR